MLVKLKKVNLFGGEKLPTRPSAMKHLRADERKRQRNMRVKSAMQRVIREAETKILANEPDAEEAFRLAVRELDRTVSKGVIKKGKADRKKSRLAKKLNVMKMG